MRVVCHSVNTSESARVETTIQTGLMYDRNRTVNQSLIYCSTLVGQGFVLLVLLEWGRAVTHVDCVCACVHC